MNISLLVSFYLLLCKPPRLAPFRFYSRIWHFTAANARFYGSMPHDGSLVGCLPSCTDEDQCRSQREDKSSSGDYKCEMHAQDERMLIPHKRSQDRDP